MSIFVDLSQSNDIDILVGNILKELKPESNLLNREIYKALRVDSELLGVVDKGDLTLESQEQKIAFRRYKDSTLTGDSEDFWILSGIAQNAKGSYVKRENDIIGPNIARARSSSYFRKVQQTIERRALMESEYNPSEEDLEELEELEKELNERATSESKPKSKYRTTTRPTTP